jgi:diguanylate cyclase (GGDEF)-like protein
LTHHKKSNINLKGSYEDSLTKPRFKRLSESLKIAFENNFLILNSNVKEAEFIKKLSVPKGRIYTSLSIEKTITLLENTSFNVAIIDASMAHYSQLKGLFREITSIIVTGLSQPELTSIANEWPRNHHVDMISTICLRENNTSFLLALDMATKHSHLIKKLKLLSHSQEQNKAELKEAFSQISEIKSFIKNSALKELEKRISIEANYIWLKQEKQKIEDLLIKLYRANDITSLIDIVFDIKDLVQARGISFYIIDKNGSRGEYLKPLVWNNHIPSHEDLSDLSVSLNSEDFAADTVLRKCDINTSKFEFENRLSSRYINLLNYPLKSILCVPIKHNEDIIGTLEVYNKIKNGNLQKDGFSKEDQKTLRKLSEHISIAINKLNLIQFDALTGLLRPAPFFEKVLLKLRSENKRHEENPTYSLVMGDVDWFKYYNDHNGHEAGNIILRELAEILKSSVREEDIICRYGGEEFLFFLTSIKSKEESLVFTDRIKKNIEDYYFKNQESQPKNNLTMSFGITNFSKDESPNWKNMTLTKLKYFINEADKALLEAKGNRNYILYSTKDSVEIRDKNKICIYQDLPEAESEKHFNGISSEKQSFEEKRKHPRYYSSASLISRNGFEIQVTMTINLSLGGAKIFSEKQFPPGKKLDIIAILGKTALECKGYVVYSYKNEPNLPSYHSGLKFSELSLNGRQVLRDHLSSISPPKKTTFN